MTNDMKKFLTIAAAIICLCSCAAFRLTPAQEAKIAEAVADSLSQRHYTIDITRMDYSELTLYLSDELVNLRKPITVKIRGKRVFKGRVKPSADTYRQTLYERQDPRFAAPCKITVRPALSGS